MNKMNITINSIYGMIKKVISNSLQNIFICIEIIGIQNSNYISRSHFYAFIHGIINTFIFFRYPFQSTREF